MKLPKSIKGFTLIELLIVISIIAVLSVIGAVVYGGVQKGARDSRRISDINAIASAMEAQYGKGTIAGQYAPLARNFFSSGEVPVDPLGTPNTSCVSGAACYFCVQYSQATAPAATQVATTCATAAGGTPGLTPVGAGNPAGGANGYWMVCANLESPVSGRAYYCRTNQQ